VPDDPKAILPASAPFERALDLGATVGAGLPILGGVVSSVLSGMAGRRRFERVQTVVIDLSERLDTLDQEQQDYVTSEDFEDILTETLQRVWAERSEAKRRVYGNFLLRIIESPGGSFDDQLEFLRILEQLQPDHLRLIDALLEEPEPGETSNTAFGTLSRRLPDIPEERIKELATRLLDLHLATVPGGMMTAAVDLRGYFTPQGQRFVAFLTD
jgi:hypothetical protein